MIDREGVGRTHAEVLPRAPLADVGWRTVCRLDDLREDEPLRVVVDDLAICLVRTCGEVFAVRDQCTHEAIPLSEGDVDDCAIECWLHGSRFDLRTGKVLNLPATRPVAVYPVRVREGEVSVSLGQPDDT